MPPGGELAAVWASKLNQPKGSVQEYNDVLAESYGKITNQIDGVDPSKPRTATSTRLKECAISGKVFFIKIPVLLTVIIQIIQNERSYSSMITVSAKFSKASSVF